MTTPTYYHRGAQRALATLGLKEASLRTVGIRSRADPFQEIHRRLSRAFAIKTPKFDIAAQLKRMLNNPFQQPTQLLAGKIRPLQV